MRIPHQSHAWFVAVIVLWSAWTGFGLGQTESAPEEAGATVEQLVGLALSGNLELAAARERLAEARGLVRQAGVRPNPSIDVSVQNGDAFGSTGEREYGFSYSQVMELGGKRSRRMEVAQLDLELLSQEVSDRERLLVAQVRTAFANALAAMRKYRDAEDLLELTQQNRSLVKARAEAGEGSRLEQGLLEVEVNRMLSERLVFAAEIERFLFDAKLLAGLPPETALEISGSLSERPTKPDRARALERALAQRPDLAAARVREKRADAELQLARVAGTPDLTASAGYTRAEARFDQFGFSGPGGMLVPLRDADNVLVVGLSIQLPVRDQNRGSIQAAVARQRAARLEREALERRVRAEVSNAFNRLESAERALQLLETGVMPQSQENLRVVRGAYELGELRLLDVINEQRRLIEVQRANTELLRDAYQARIELERVIGAPVN